MIDNLQRMIAEAHAHRVSDMLVTALNHSPALSRLLGCEIYLKCEHHQTTGSFKYRGAANKLRILKSGGLKGDVVTASSGNHGQAVALAGRNAGVPVTVYVAANASPAKMEAIKGYGAKLVVLETDPLKRRWHC